MLEGPIDYIRDRWLMNVDVSHRIQVQVSLFRMVLEVLFVRTSSCLGGFEDLVRTMNGPGPFIFFQVEHWTTRLVRFRFLRDPVSGAHGEPRLGLPGHAKATSLPKPGEMNVSTSC